MSKDTITVELPIEAKDDGYVHVQYMGNMSRESWRVAANGGGDWAEIVRHLAPAVVAWIERDEWEPLDLPEVGRRIRATLRDGRDETFEVGHVNNYGIEWVAVHAVNNPFASCYIQRTRGAKGPTANDIIAWEYVDEPATTVTVEQLRVVAQIIEDLIDDRCWCESCGSSEELARKLLAKACPTVAGESDG